MDISGKSSLTGIDLVETLKGYEKEYKAYEEKYKHGTGTFMLGYYSGITDLLGLILGRIAGGEFDRNQRQIANVGTAEYLHCFLCGGENVENPALYNDHWVHKRCLEKIP